MKVSQSAKFWRKSLFHCFTLFFRTAVSLFRCFTVKLFHLFHLFHPIIFSQIRIIFEDRPFKHLIMIPDRRQMSSSVFIPVVVDSFRFAKLVRVAVRKRLGRDDFVAGADVWLVARRTVELVFVRIRAFVGQRWGSRNGTNGVLRVCYPASHVFPVAGKDGRNGGDHR